MKKAVTLEFSELGQKVPIELDESHSPKTVRAIIDKLPIRTTINRRGDELYTDETSVKVGEENSKSAVSQMWMWRTGRKAMRSVLFLRPDAH